MTIPDSALTTSPVIRLRAGKAETIQDVLVVEEPLEIRLGYNDPRKGRIHKSISITMRTPGNDVVLALGFLYAESIIKSLETVTAIDTTTNNVIRIELSNSANFDSQRLERHFYTTSSCGVCGKASLESLSLTGFDAITHDTFSVQASVLYKLSEELKTQQSLFRQTGGNHATALFDAEGNISLLAEDVGRHNAMDKLLGTLLQQKGLPLKQHGILVSGRASFELLQKALAGGCSMLAAVGAPSSLAVELAQEFNITLIGFLSDTRFNIYHGAHRVIQPSE
ncbi:MAG: formate dehydrogenase accessory sulfurtransferase FdhD [Pseudomonadota bacterium]